MDKRIRGYKYVTAIAAMMILLAVARSALANEVFWICNGVTTVVGDQSEADLDPGEHHVRANFTCAGPNWFAQGTVIGNESPGFAAVTHLTGGFVGPGMPPAFIVEHTGGPGVAADQIGYGHNFEPIGPPAQTRTYLFGFYDDTEPPPALPWITFADVLLDTYVNDIAIGVIDPEPADDLPPIVPFAGNSGPVDEAPASSHLGIVPFTLAAIGDAVVFPNSADTLTTSCFGNLTHDGVIGAADLAVLLGAWGPNLHHPADLDFDGVVGAADLAILLGNWGPCPDPGPICGNGIVEEGEDCDPPDGEICDENCQYILSGCCLPDQSCMSDVTADLCQDLGGTPVTDCAECATGEIYLDLTPESISIEPTPDGMVTVSVPTQVLVSAPEPVPDIETFAEIRVNGLAVDVVPLSVDLPAEAGLCYLSAWPACDGWCPFSAPCKPFPAPPEICYCEYYTLVIAAVPANAGDLITVVLDSPDLVHEVDEQNNEISGVVPGGGGHTGDCCNANGTPGCDDPICQEMICSIDPFCCKVVWDETCAGEAADLCEVCGPNCFSQWNDCHGAATDQTCAACLQGPVPLGVSWMDANGNCHTTCP